MHISIIIPVHAAGITLSRCLAALSKTTYPDWNCIVVADSAFADIVDAAAAYGYQVVENDPPGGGPAVARNLGARLAGGDVLLFIDADVLVTPETVGQVAQIMEADEDMAACFGSYDDSPGEANFLSQYRNLQHHFVHQVSRQEAATFWSGCGAIRRQLFLRMGGFNPNYRWPSIEDIELGYRLRARGHTIRLQKSLQVQHLKRWTARQLLGTDIYRRAIPWSQLILKQGQLPDDLNLQTSQRFSAVLLFTAMAALPATLVTPWAWVAAGLTLLLLLFYNREFYRFLQRQRGIGFLLRALPWHWLYYIYSSLSFAGCLLWYRILRFDNPSPGMNQLPPLLPLANSPATSNQV